MTSKQNWLSGLKVGDEVVVKHPAMTHSALVRWCVKITSIDGDNIAVEFGGWLTGVTATVTRGEVYKPRKGELWGYDADSLEAERLQDSRKP